jgi:hypothetical protein
MVNSTMIDAYGRTAEERAELREKIKQVNADAQANWHDPSWRAEMAADLTETIFMGFQHENLLSLLAEVENAGFNDRVFVKEVRGLRAFWIARGGYIEESTLKQEVMEIGRDTIGFHVSEFEDKLITNFAETQATLIELGIQRMDAEVNRRVLALFQAAIPDSSSPYYIDDSGVSLTSLNTALREVRDESRTFDITILGRATMISQIEDELLGGSNNGSGFLPETNEQLVQRGVLGTYRGARLVTLKNWKDDEDIAFFPANEMYVISRDASKFAFWGGLQSKEFVENDNWYWHYLARRDFGGVIHRPERLRRIIDTSLDA